MVTGAKNTRILTHDCYDWLEDITHFFKPSLDLGENALDPDSVPGP